MGESAPERILHPIEDALLSVIQVCRRENPSVLWDLLKLEIPKSAADLIVVICTERGNPYPALDCLM
jgi:hypothetical protein